MKTLRFKTIIGPAIAFILLGTAPSPAEDSPEIPARIAPDGRRFLFVVETSTHSRRLAEASRQTVFDLILNGVNGHMRNGDTFGLWTYSDELQAGDFPMSVWDTNRCLELAGRAATYLDKKKHSNKPDIAKVIANLRLLSDKIGDFDVFIVSAGREAIAGTPFDDKVNTAYAAYEKRPGRLAKLPLITTFVVRKGRPIRAFIGLAGEFIPLPYRPPALGPSPATNAPAALQAKVSRPEPAPRPKIIQFVTKSNSPSAAPTPMPAARPALSSAISPAPALPMPLLSELPLQASSEIASSASTNSLIATPPAINPPLASPMGPPVPKKGFVSMLAPFPEIIAQARTVGSNDSAPPPIPSAPLPEQAGLAQASRSGPPVSPSLDPQVPGSNPAAPVQVQAVTANSAGGLSSGVLLMIGGVLFVATGFLYFLVLRRQGTDRGGSLITQSMAGRER